MPNHINRSRAGSPARNPTPEEVRTARETAGLSQTAATDVLDWLQALPEATRIPAWS